MRRSAFALCAAALLLGGCSILNTPDRTRITDAGADVMPDAPMDTAPDVPPDAPEDTPPDTPEDGGVDAGPGVETSCGNGTDDDGDTLVDCADFDCAGNDACCAAGTVLLEERWEAADLSSSWKPVPSADPLLPARGTDGSSRYLSSFESTTEPHAIVARQCIPVAVGMTLTGTLDPQGDASCPGDMPCDSFAALVLTPADDVLSGNRLLDDLAVTMYGGGFLEVTNDGNRLASTSVPASATGTRYEITIDLAPGVGRGGHPALFATVRHRRVGGGGDPEVLLASREVVRQSDLIQDAGGCERVPGLNVAVEGQGASVYVHPTLEVSTQQCVNPSQFVPPVGGDVALRRADLSFARFAEGGIGAPALTSSRESSSGPVRWDVFVEGTNVDPELEKFTHVGYAAGHARSTNWNNTPWGSSGTPKMGDAVPSCLDETVPCDGLRSIREPAALPRLGALDTLQSFDVAYAREMDPAVVGDRDIFALHTFTPASATPTTPLPFLGAAILTPEDLEALPTPPGCRSLRDPSLIPDALDGYWLFFTCERNAAPDEIHAVHLLSTLELDRTTSPFVHQRVLSASDLGAYAADGVRSPEAVLEEPSDGTTPPVVRLWFLARALGGRTTVAMAQGQAGEVALHDALPTFEPFGANPVLAPDAPVLGACMDCPILGLAVARRADDANTLRFLLARRVNDPTDGLVYELLPLEQFWSSL